MVWFFIHFIEVFSGITNRSLVSLITFASFLNFDEKLFISWNNFSDTSSDRDIFDRSMKTFKDALKWSGFKDELNYIPS